MPVRLGGAEIPVMSGDDEKGTQIVRTLGGPQQQPVINEPGLYRAIFNSRVEAAERFKRWLAHDVIPQIRKTGRYEAPAAPAPVPALPAPDPWAVMQLDLQVKVQITITAEHQAFSQALAHLPIGPSNKRPTGWWSDSEVRRARQLGPESVQGRGGLMGQQSLPTAAPKWEIDLEVGSGTCHFHRQRFTPVGGGGSAKALMDHALNAF